MAALYRRRWRLFRRFPDELHVAAFVRRLQSGIVNDYVTWLVLGVACIGGALALTLR
jgi:hypothetical protein